jgi:UDP-N-acetylglucosamine 2-epimerase (non-hydrolysing)
MVAFHAQIPFVHVEAGLRTGDLNAPFPEEYYRRIATLGASLHCAPTDRAQLALIEEGIPPERSPVTGNTVIDALLTMVEAHPAVPVNFPRARRPILVTAHRRENQAGGLQSAFEGLRRIVDVFEDIGIFFPVHPNPATRETAQKILGGHPQIILTDPLCYRDLVACLENCWLVITDSGGLQEEAPALGRPVLVLRDVTERPEAVSTGVVRLVGTSAERLFEEVSLLCRNEGAYQAMAHPVFPYGDGLASDRIVAAMRSMLGK